MSFAIPVRRPGGLRRLGLPTGTSLWRLDSSPPGEWSWSGFPSARHRFDPASGAFRVRYAATTPHGAARERYHDSGRYVPAGDAEHFLVTLRAVRPVRVLDLRSEPVKDALGVDDRISTSRESVVWGACHELVDRTRSWWPDLDGILYRSRTTSETSANVAFWDVDWAEVSAQRFAAVDELLAELVVRHGFTFGFDF